MKVILKEVLKSLLRVFTGVLELIYLLIKNINTLVGKLFMKLPRILKVGVIYSLIAMATLGVLKENKIEIQKVTEPLIIKMVEAKEQTPSEACKWSEIECFVYSSAISQGLTKNQATIVLAVSKHETGSWTSAIYKNNHNFGGIIRNGKFESYESDEAGIKDMIHVLKDYYFASGRNTIEEIGAKYCPVGASNDPSGLNNYWIPRVTQYYNEYLKNS